MIAFFVVALGAVVAAVGTGVLVARSTQRPRIYLLTWAAGLLGLAVGLGANAIGYLHGYSDLIFRAMELSTALIATLSLCVALVEMLGRRLSARFAMRLAASGIFVIAVVILGTDPISSDVTFGKGWPDPAVFYQTIPLTVLGFLALFTVVTAVSSLAIAALRSSRGQLPRDEAGPVILVAAAAFAVVLPELAWLAQKSAGIAPLLPAKDLFAASCTLTAVLAAYAAQRAGRRELGQAPSQAAVRDHADRDWDGGQASGGWDEDQSGPSAWQPEDEPYRSQVTGAASEHYLDDNGLDGIGDYDDGRRVGARTYADAESDFHYPGLAALIGDEPEEIAGAAPDFSDHLRSDARDTDRQEQLFGQITIYTLAEGRADEFDRLTEWIMTLVRAKEPDTLVYIVHAVPTAPGQRILYEVYRDRAAHDEHMQRSYVQRYESEQRQFVVATNVIELGLQHAKVSPLPSISAISDILSESGIDLTGVTMSSPPRLRSEYQPLYSEQDPQYQGWAEIRGDGLGEIRDDGWSEVRDERWGEVRDEGWAEIRGEDSRY